MGNFKPCDGHYSGIQTGHVVEFTAPDTETFMIQKFKCAIPKGAEGVRGINIPVSVTVLFNEVKKVEFK